MPMGKGVHPAFDTPEQKKKESHYAEMGKSHVAATRAGWAAEDDAYMSPKITKASFTDSTGREAGDATYMKEYGNQMLKRDTERMHDTAMAESAKSAPKKKK